MVYIQSDIDRKLPSNFDAACALYGALDNAQDIRLTSFEEVQSGKFDMLIRNNLFVGSVEFMTEVFKRIDKVVHSMNPSQSHIIAKISDVKPIISEGEKLFIKSVGSKVISGLVYDTMTLSNLDKYPQDTEIYVSLPFKNKIITEWRCYVRNKTIIDARNYSGDFSVTPDFNYAENIVANNKDYPSAYTIDIALMDNGKTEVIEYNDMWAIGNYGIDNTDYYKLLRERYFEIVRCN